MCIRDSVKKPYSIDGVHFKQLNDGRIEAEVNSAYNGQYTKTIAEGDVYKRQI